MSENTIPAAPTKTVANKKVVAKSEETTAATETRDAKLGKKKDSKLPKKPTEDKKIQVVAIAKGWYDNFRKERNDKFTIRDMSEFSENWMVLVDTKAK